MTDQFQPRYRDGAQLRRVERRNPLADMPLSRPERLAVFGGSFDPVHNGHLALARQIVAGDHADEVMFVPARRPPHKLGRALTPGEHRLAMLRLAIADDEAFSVSDIELTRSEGLSYTFDTLAALRLVFPEPVLFFLLGMDSLADLHKWHRAGELVQHVEFLVYPRPGVTCPSLAELSDRFGVRVARKLLASVREELPQFAFSSSDVRQAKAAGRDIEGLCPEPVCQYIEMHGLYSKPGAAAAAAGGPESKVT